MFGTEGEMLQKPGGTANDQPWADKPQSVHAHPPVSKRGPRRLLRFPHCGAHSHETGGHQGVAERKGRDDFWGGGRALRMR